MTKPTDKALKAAATAAFYDSAAQLPGISRKVNSYAAGNAGSYKLAIPYFVHRKVCYLEQDAFNCLLVLVEACNDDELSYTNPASLLGRSKDEDFAHALDWRAKTGYEQVLTFCAEPATRQVGDKTYYAVPADVFDFAVNRLACAANRLQTDRNLPARDRTFWMEKLQGFVFNEISVWDRLGWSRRSRSRGAEMTARLIVAA